MKPLYPLQSTVHWLVTKIVFLRQQTAVAVGRKIISTSGSVEIHRLNSLLQSPSSEANLYFLGHILWNPKVQYPTPNSLALLPLLSHTIRYYFFKTHFNIILPATRTYSSGTFSSYFPTKTLWHFSSPLYEPHASPVSFSSYLITRILFAWREKYHEFRRYAVFSIPLLPPIRPKYLRQHPTRKRHQAMLFLNVRRHFAHPSTTGKTASSSLINESSYHSMPSIDM
jgi:hypothetical protein